MINKNFFRALAVAVCASVLTLGLNAGCSNKCCGAKANCKTNCAEAKCCCGGKGCDKCKKTETKVTTETKTTTGK